MYYSVNILSILSFHVESVCTDIYTREYRTPDKEIYPILHGIRANPSLQPLNFFFLSLVVCYFLPPLLHHEQGR